MAKKKAKFKFEVSNLTSEEKSFINFMMKNGEVVIKKDEDKVYGCYRLKTVQSQFSESGPEMIEPMMVFAAGEDTTLEFDSSNNIVYDNNGATLKGTVTYNLNFYQLDSDGSPEKANSSYDGINIAVSTFNENNQLVTDEAGVKPNAALLRIPVGDTYVNRSGNEVAYTARTQYFSFSDDDELEPDYYFYKVGFLPIAENVKVKVTEDDDESCISLTNILSNQTIAVQPVDKGIEFSSSISDDDSTVVYQVISVLHNATGKAPDSFIAPMVSMTESEFTLLGAAYFKLYKYVNGTTAATEVKSAEAPSGTDTCTVGIDEYHHLDGKDEDPISESEESDDEGEV